MALALVTGLAAPGSPAAAAVVVEAITAPPGAQAPLAAGDAVVRWRLTGASPARSGELAHWGELELLPLIESPRGTLEIDLVRGGSPQRVTLAPAAWILKGRPAGAGAELLAFVAGFADKSSTLDATGVEGRLAGTSDEIRSWVWVRFADARGKRSDWLGAEQGYAIAIALSPAIVAADLERFRGDALRRLGRLAEAEAAYRRALAVWNRLEPAGLGASTALGALGSLRAAQYELAEANRFYAEVAAIRKRLAAGSWLYANALNNLGTLAGRRNDLAAAEDYLLEALAIAERGQGDAAPLLANLGIVARLRGDFERAEMYTRRAIGLFREAGNRREMASKLMTLANVLGDLGRFDDAFATYAEALAGLAGEHPDRELVGTVHANRAKVFQLKGDYPAAATDLAAARTWLAFELPRTSTEALVTALESEQAKARGDLGEAGRLAEITLSARSRLQPDTSFEAQAASELAGVRDLQGRTADADTLFQRSIRALERQQQRLGGGDRGLVAFRTKYAGIYRAYQEFLLRNARTEAAFELYERSRAQALLALLQQRDLDFTENDLPPSLHSRRSAILLDIDRAYLALAKVPEDDATAREAQRQALESLHAERELVTREIHAASPRLAAIEAPPALALDAIRRGLAPGTLLLAYSVGAKSSTLFALPAGGELTAHPIAAGEPELAADVRRWVELTTATTLGRAELAGLERRLGDRLLSPVAGQLAKARRLLVVPDGALHALAFAALPDPRDPGKRLIEALPVSHQVSASVHAALARRPAAGIGAIGAIGSVAVFADPVTAATAPARLRRELGRLPATRREAARVNQAFGGRAHLFLDADATEATARREMASASLAHFATHAVVDEALPLDSALVLSPSGGDEGLLQAWEIAEQVKLTSDLVVLSACETARGGDRGGEGVLGLVRAMQVAGARSVVASLWRVDDESTAELMGRFYSALATGLPRDEALRRAQLELLRGGVEVERDGRKVALRTSEPRHWAPFILIGPAD